MSEYIYGTNKHGGYWLTDTEVIRCKDCRKHNQIHGQDWCKESARYVEPECFCSWAERRQQ